jgi:DNA-binding transcriptional ArsR family regulator
MNVLALAAIGAAISDPTRLAVLAHANGRTSLVEIARDLNVASPTVSHHVAVLHRAGLVEITRRGRRTLPRRVPGVGVRLARELG